MFREEKHLKDSSENLGVVIKDNSTPISYTKTNKLITALYMVTDIMDKDEPLRNKLRTLGTEIISDINSSPLQVCSKISEIMSFLDIASAVNIISQMNCNILRKEFLELDQSVKDSGNKTAIIDRKINLSKFFTEEADNSHIPLPKDNYSRNGHPLHRIGVQKGSTLLKALSEKTLSLSDKNNGHLRTGHPTLSMGGFDALKKQRREDILNIIKIIGGNATIKDIKDKAKSLPAGMGSLSSCGEKTLQRELISMVKDDVLKKTGEKRWSRYFVK